MSNKQRNVEATLIHRPVATGQAKDNLEAVISAIVLILFGIDLLPPCNPNALFHRA